MHGTINTKHVYAIHVNVSTVGLFGEEHNYGVRKWPSNCSPWTPGGLRDYFWNRSILLNISDKTQHNTYLPVIMAQISSKFCCVVPLFFPLISGSLSALLGTPDSL